MSTFILADPEKCIGCRTCSLACSFQHDEEFSLSLARIAPLWMQDLGRFVPVACHQCEDALCVEACPRGAISTDPATGAKVVDEDLCIGCRACFLVCPFGVPSFHRDRGHMIKCDLCGGSPHCVEECPREALSAVRGDEASLRKRREAAKRLSDLIDKAS